MGFKNILVPYDNSEHANNALKEAINMASENPEAKIHVVEVVAPPQDLVYSSINQTGFGMGVSVVAKGDFAKVVEERNAEQDKELQDTIADVVEGFPGALTAEVVFGVYTIETIIETAKHYDCDLIVMGSRGLGAIRGAIGSACFAPPKFPYWWLSRKSLIRKAHSWEVASSIFREKGRREQSRCSFSF